MAASAVPPSTPSHTYWLASFFLGGFLTLLPSCFFLLIGLFDPEVVVGHSLGFSHVTSRSAFP